MVTQTTKQIQTALETSLLKKLTDLKLPVPKSTLSGIVTSVSSTAATGMVKDVNNTANSRIFLKNNNGEPKVKIEGGKLYLYYDYDFTNAPTIPAGWTDILAYAIANRQTLLLHTIDFIGF